MIELIGIVGAAFHVTMGATVGVAFWWPKQSRKWAAATLSFWVLYWVLMFIDGMVL